MSAPATSRRRHRSRRLEAARARAPRPPLAPIGVALVLVVAVFVLLAQWTLFPADVRGQDNALRDLAVAVVRGLAGIRMATCGTAAGAVALVGALVCWGSPTLRP